MRYWQPKLRVVGPGTWLQFDASRRIAIIRTVTAGYPPRPLLRADTWSADDDARAFLGYFPADEIRLCAEVVWALYQEATSAQVKDAAVNTKQPGSTQWHPLLNADENSPGTWTMRDSDGHAYGGIRITRQGTDVYYLAQYRGNPIGRFDRLRTAVETVHLAHVRTTQHPRVPPDPYATPRS
ncbi:hypothetical protein FLP10_00765 [Agromyces intestinalis]|uniref:Uncharacterized protein n=1 Tax=Agromyces intestinalis TaxID=2592652 RepID=A0A5C1YD40_9MICO|nr:hypothetical protein [Agromyces intestinalis]QEO13109.1 hypothetical protein FLP10_00765 [Agromyces intestinalis]